MDRAGWHCAGDLVMPDNITAVFLPPYSPELNAIERLWLYLMERFLPHRLWHDDDAIVDAVCNAWQQVTSDTGRIKSLCSMDSERWKGPFCRGRRRPPSHRPASASRSAAAGR